MQMWRSCVMYWVAMVMDLVGCAILVLMQILGIAIAVLRYKVDRRASDYQIATTDDLSNAVVPVLVWLVQTGILAVHAWLCSAVAQRLRV